MLVTYSMYARPVLLTSPGQIYPRLTFLANLDKVIPVAMKQLPLLSVFISP